MRTPVRAPARILAGRSILGTSGATRRAALVTSDSRWWRAVGVVGPVPVTLGLEVGQREQHLGQRDAVGQRVVQPHEDRRALGQALDQVDVPQRSVAGQRGGQELRDVGLQGRVVTGRVQTHLPHVAAQVERPGVAPAGRPLPRRPGTGRREKTG